MAVSHGDVAVLLRKHGYTELEKIGQGGFGKALLVQSDNGGGAKLLCKLVDLSSTSSESQETKDALKEAQLLATFRHPYIVCYSGSFLESGWLAILMEYCEGGDLKREIALAKKEDTPIPEPQVLRWMTQAIFALRYVHNNGVLHRDLKPANFFLSKAKLLKMGDFGVAKILSSTVPCAQTLIGTPYYMSPEAFQDVPYERPADMWAMGCILYELCERTVPFEATKIGALMRKICEDPVPLIGSGYSDVCGNLCSALLNKDPALRPSAEAVLQRPSIQEVVMMLLLHEGQAAQEAQAQLIPPRSHAAPGVLRRRVDVLPLFAACCLAFFWSSFDRLEGELRRRVDVLPLFAACCLAFFWSSFDWLGGANERPTQAASARATADADGGATDETTAAQPPRGPTPGSGVDAVAASAAEGVVAALAPAPVAPAASAAAAADATAPSPTAPVPPVEVAAPAPAKSKAPSPTAGVPPVEVAAPAPAESKAPSPTAAVPPVEVAAPAPAESKAQLIPPGSHAARVAPAGGRPRREPTPGSSDDDEPGSSHDHDALAALAAPGDPAASAAAAADAMAKFLGSLSPAQREQAQAHGPTILNLSNMLLGSHGVRPLAEALKMDRTLETIWLHVNNLGDQGAEHISSALLVNKTVRQICLQGNNIGELGAEFISKALVKNATLQQIDLFSNQIGDTGAEFISKALVKNATLQTISLNSNQIGDTGAEFLSDALKVNASLIHISLWNNQIGDEGARSFARALTVNGTLKDIDLDDNKIGSEGHKALEGAKRPGLTIRHR